jgi:hypothetical protein
MMTVTGNDSVHSHVKAHIIADLILSPMYKSEIVSKYVKPTSKGVYRHLRDLESEKVIREKREKGEKPLIALNVKDLTGSSKAFEYLLDADEKLSNSFDKAFVECALSAYGDFLIFDTLGDDTINIQMMAYQSLIEGKRPVIDDDITARVIDAIEKLRGHMTIEDKIIYIAFVHLISVSKWSPEKESPKGLSTTFMYPPGKPIRNEAPDKMVAAALTWLWNIGYWELSLMARGKRKNILGDVKGDRELRLMTAKILLSGAPELPLADIEQETSHGTLLNRVLTLR